jgi:hypothetical protein
VRSSRRAALVETGFRRARPHRFGGLSGGDALVRPPPDGPAFPSGSSTPIRTLRPRHCSSGSPQSGESPHRGRPGRDGAQEPDQAGSGPRSGAVARRCGSDAYDVAIVGAGQPGWRLRSTGLPRASRSWSSKG